MSVFAPARKLLNVSMALWLTGCASASMVQTTYQPAIGGIVKYKDSLLGGKPSAQKAQDMMAQFCAPSKYAVIQQQASTETVGYSSKTSGTL